MGVVALVTGGAAGIGRAAVLAFAARGAKVVIADVKVEQGEELARAVSDRGGEAIFVRTDVSRADEVDALVSRAVSTFGRLDYAFNNAGIEGSLGATAGCSEENFDRVLAVNLKGLWLCMRREIAQMLTQPEGGAIVNMSSVAGLVGFANLPAYVASKHAVVGLTKAAALEYAQRRIRVNAICPGVIHTEMVDRVTGRNPEVEKQFVGLEPMGRMGRPDEIAEPVIWLCSSGASFVTGHALTVDGGLVAQ
ncbi:MAG: SDR family oxidoreductase [Pseudomonadota bacterium]|nr:MAG: short chain dehydrogenase [Pseudomonadota bacterium]